jgi:hypothetical protein
MATAQSPQPAHVFCQRIAHVGGERNPPECILVNGAKLLVPPLIASHIATGDEITFSLDGLSASEETEILVKKKSHFAHSSELYQAPVGYVTQPKKDTRNQLFVCAEVRHGNFGIGSVFLPCKVLREYFYCISPDRERAEQRTLYELLRMPATSSPAELRVGFKLRLLELPRDVASGTERVVLERAFNILADPELRACYDMLLAHAETPAVFPYGGFGSLLVSGERSRDGRTFFARRILAYKPEWRQRRFPAQLRHCDFYDDRAFYCDARRRLELWIDPAVLHITWDATWNQWKHLLPTKMEVSATFVESGKYRRRRGQWELVQWETALPSRLEIKLPDEIQEQLDTARTTYRRFGQYSAALDRIRACIESRAVEKAELEKMCSDLRIPGDLDVAQINWKPNYDRFFYRQLSRRARRIYLFRDEYIFDLEKAAVAETPQLGHATYVFAKPKSMEGFLATYTKITKDDIRQNRDNVAARLGFQGRVIHGIDPRAWFNELKRRVGEAG